ncbi:MAG: hypothetical protein KIH62_003085 [Candidatus Kerfeldbacteria bacterium]|nr:hypothetical protein [Candidatus Kerfeldbacteria bacterium]
MALFNRQEVIRPLTLAALAAIIIFAVVLRVRNGGSVREVEELTPQTFGELINSIYPTDEELRNTQLITTTTRERKSEAINTISRDGFPTEAYISKPEGDGPFPFIIIVPDPFVEDDAQIVSQTVGELYSTALKAVVVVVQPRATHRGLDDVTDTLAFIEWQEKVVEIHDQPQLVIGVGYGAWLAAKAAETTQPQYIAYFSPIFDLRATDVQQTFRSTFVAQSDCSAKVDSETCLADLEEVTIPDLPTYVQTTSGETSDRSGDLQRIIDALTTTPTTSVLPSTASLRSLMVNGTVADLAQSLSVFSTWYESEVLDVAVEESEPSTSNQ